MGLLCNVWQHACMFVVDFHTDNHILTVALNTIAKRTHTKDVSGQKIGQTIQRNIYINRAYCMSKIAYR